MITSNTCLAVLRDDKGKLWFAGDRRISWGFHKAQTMTHPKIALRNGVLFAGTGTSFLCTEIVDFFNPPKLVGKTHPADYVHSKFMPALLQHLRQKGLVKKDESRLAETKLKEDEKAMAIILVGVKDELFELDLSESYLIIDRINAPYAHGCGGQLALGALLATEGSPGYPPADRLIKALQIAASVSPGCDDNIDILHN